MSQAKVFYHTGDKRSETAIVTGKVDWIGDYWITIIPDNEKVEKMLIPMMRIISVEYQAHPLDEDVCLTDKKELQLPDYESIAWCNVCALHREDAVPGEICPEHPEFVLTESPLLKQKRKE